MDSKQLITQFKLPSYIKGKSFADASKAINKKFEGRNDMTSKNTKNELLTRLAHAQEYLKSQQSEQVHASPEVSQGQEYNEGQMFAGGFQAPSGNLPNSIGYSFNNNPTVSMDTADGKIPNTAGINAYNNLAPILANSINSEGNDMQRTQTVQAVNNLGNTAGSLIGGAAGSTVGSAVTGATGLYDMGMEAFGNSNIDTSGKQATGEVKVGKSVGAGALKGAGTGAAIGSIIPGVGTVIGAGVGAVVGGVAGFVGGKKDKKAQTKNNRNYSARVNNQYSDQFADGGPIEEYYSRNNPYFMTNPGQVSTGDYYQDLQLTPRNTAPIESVNFLNPVGMTGQTPSTTFQGINTTPLKGGPSFMDQVAYGAKKTGNFINDNAANALRYAPALANAYQLSKLKKPKGERLDRLTNRYTPEYVDERQLQNITGNEMTNSINAITQSGGSQGAVRSSILASALNKSKALSDAYANASAANRATNDRAQSFNLGIDQVNLNQSNTERENLARDMGNYDTQKSKLIGQLGNDIGQIGKEQVFKKYPKLMGLRYDSNGEYFIKPDGTKLTAEQIKIQNPSLTPQELTQLLKDNNINTNSKGGYLSSSTVKHMSNLYKRKK